MLNNEKIVESGIKANNIRNLQGLKLILDRNIVEIYVYPTGYKDGNKLGKRKCNLVRENMYIDTYTSTVFCSPKTYELLTKGLKNA